MVIASIFHPLPVRNAYSQQREVKQPVGVTQMVPEAAINNGWSVASEEQAKKSTRMAASIHG